MTWPPKVSLPAAVGTSVIITCAFVTLLWHPSRREVRHCLLLSSIWHGNSRANGSVTIAKRSKLPCFQMKHRAIIIIIIKLPN
jgi:hypothetical protein